MERYRTDLKGKKAIVDGGNASSYVIRVFAAEKQSFAPIIFPPGLIIKIGDNRDRPHSLYSIRLSVGSVIPINTLVVEGVNPVW